MSLGRPGKWGGRRSGYKGIDAFAHAGDFADFYHILQTGMLYYFYCYLQGGIAIPSSPVTSSIDLAKWVLMTSFGAYEGEPVGEGPADYSP
jgi:hypothetical protein